MTGQEKKTAAAWFVARGEAQLGPFAEAEVLRQVRSGEIEPHDHVLTAGWPEWREAGQVFKLAVPAPLPPPQVEPRPPVSIAAPAERAQRAV